MKEERKLVEVIKPKSLKETHHKHIIKASQTQHKNITNTSKTHYKHSFNKLGIAQHPKHEFYYIIQCKNLKTTNYNHEEIKLVWNSL